MISSKWKYLTKLTSYFHGLISDRRFPVKVGASGVFGISGIGAFSDAYGLEGVIGYISVLALLRVLFSIPVSLAVKRFPATMLEAHRWSPCLILLGSMSMLSGHLWILPICLALYISTWWTMYHSLREIRGKSTGDFVDVEVWSSILGTILALVITHEFSIYIAGAVGGFLCLAGAIIPVDVSAEELLDALETWQKEASSRSRAEIANGARIARGVGTIGFCSLSSLRITLLDTPDGASLFQGVLSLGLVVVLMELVVWLWTSKTTQGLRDLFSSKDKGGQGREYGGRRDTVVAFIFTVAGFSAMMMTESIEVFCTGYILVSISTRGVNREVDQEFARSNLRGINGNPAAREIEKFSTWLFLCPLLWMPWLLAPVGILGAAMLLSSSFTHPRDRGSGEGKVNGNGM